MKSKLKIEFSILVFYLIIIAPVCMSSNENKDKEEFLQIYSIDNLNLENNHIQLINQDNISFDIKIKDTNGVWQDNNITAFNGSILEFNIDLQTLRGYQILSAIITLPNTDYGPLFYIINNSLEYSKKPTILDIGKRDIILIWMPVLLPITITLSFNAEIKNIGIEKEVLGGGIGFIDYETFDLINDSVFVTSTPSPIPDKPDRPIGPTSGEPDTIYHFSTQTIDPDGDQVYYKWDWGDQIISEWEGPYNSGDTINSSHSWTLRGTYHIRVKARDESWHESDWSDSLVVSIPKNRAINQLFKILELHPNLFQ